MPSVLRRGHIGHEVAKLQCQLKAAGFNPGVIDSRFGPATEAALIAWQKSSGLLADGVCGPSSWAMLGGGRTFCRAPADVTAAVSVDLVSAMFPWTPIKPIATHLPTILAALRADGLTDKPLVLTALATIRAESEGFAPIAEQPSRFNTSPHGHMFDLYDNRRDLGNRGAPDGYRYRGRGFVQLTGRANYRLYGKEIGEGLERDPDLACEPSIAARLLSRFLAARERAIKSALVERDLGAVRRLVNGGHHGLERFMDAFERGYRLLRDEVWTIPANDDRPWASRSA